MFKKLKFECFIEIFESIFKKIDSNYIKKWCKVFKLRRFLAQQYKEESPHLMIHTKSLNTYRISSIHSEKLLTIRIHIQKLKLFDITFIAFLILYKFHDTLIEMNLNTHIFSQKIKLIVSFFS